MKDFYKYFCKDENYCTKLFHLKNIINGSITIYDHTTNKLVFKINLNKLYRIKLERK